MQPRVVFRTHYQVDEPAYLGLLITTSTFAARSDYAERVAQKLSQEARRRGRNLNIAAAGYAVDLSRALGLINDQNAWAAPGHLVALFNRERAELSESSLELSPPERFVYLRLFLDGDGAALWFLASALLEHDSLPVAGRDWNHLAQDMFVTIYQEYQKLTSATADRVALRRELDRLRTRGYSGKSGAHKMFVHLQSMYRIGLIGRKQDGGNRVYFVDDQRRLAAFSEAIGDLIRLDETIRANSWADVAAKTFDVEVEHSEMDAETLLSAIVPPYRQIAATGVAQCPLATILDAVQLDGLLSRTLVSRAALEDATIALQRSRPREIRLHVDRAGKPAFIKIADDLVVPA